MQAASPYSLEDLRYHDFPIVLLAELEFLIGGLILIGKPLRITFALGKLLGEILSTKWQLLSGLNVSLCRRSSVYQHN